MVWVPGFILLQYRPVAQALKLRIDGFVLSPPFRWRESGVLLVSWTVQCFFFLTAGDRAVVATDLPQ